MEFLKNWNRGDTGVARMLLLTARFTPQETERLIALRLRFEGGLPYLDRDLDERRLEFARWLVEHGRLREDL